MEREQAVRLTQNLLKKMVEKEGSDLFLTCGFPPAIKVDGQIHKATDTPLYGGPGSDDGAFHHERQADQRVRRDQGM